MNEQNPLWEYFANNSGRLIHKWVHYFDIYHKHFKRFRGKKISVLEFGTYHGGSLQMWKDYFGGGAKIYGVDINPQCKQLEEPGIEIFIGDQENRNFLAELAKKIGDIDIVIDDGGHTMSQQLTTFQEMYPRVKENGLYLVEDLHTSYWGEYGGGVRKGGSFIEYAKRLIDQLNAWHSHSKEELDVDDFTRTTDSIHFYDSIVVFEKRRRDKPHDEKRGAPSFSQPPRSILRKLATKIFRH